jgi:hypothetical protein
MTTLPTTTTCYRRRNAELQAQIQALLQTLCHRHFSPDELAWIDRQMRPLYAALWAMHAEINA